MLDITLQLRRYAGGVCLSTQVELDAANEIERLREALENIKKHFETISPRGFHRQSVAWAIADKALQREEGKQ